MYKLKIILQILLVENIISSSLIYIYYSRKTTLQTRLKTT